MDPVQLALTAISNIAKAAEQANANQEDCKVLADLADKTIPVLRQLEHRPIDSDLVLLQALENVAKALQQAENAVNICSTSTYFVSWIRAKEHNEMLRRATQRLEFAFGQLQLPTVGVATEMKESLSSVVEEMKRSRYRQTATHAYQTHALQEQLDKAYRMEHLGTEEVRGTIKGTLDQYSSIEHHLQDLKSLQDLLGEAKLNKSEQDVFELQQIIEVVSESIEQVKTSGKRLNVQAHLRCPITKNIMIDPVILKDSGVTYERSAIEEWIALNNRRDPSTQTDIVSGELIPNIAVKAISQAELERNGARSSTVLASSSPKDIHQAIEPGIYEGHGKKTDEDGEVNYVFVVLILAPYGSIQGYWWSESKTENIQEKAILKGHWSNDSTSLAFELKESQIEGDIEYESKGGCSCTSFTIEGSSSNTKNFIIRGDSVPVFSYSSTPGALSFKHLAPCNVQYQYMAQPGLLECEGEVIAFDNTTYRNKLVMVFERDGTVRGWMNIQDKSIGKTLASEVIGVWNDNNILSWSIYFPFSNDTTSAIEEASPSFLAEYRMNGDIVTESRDEKLGSVVISGSCKQVSLKEGHTAPFPAITEGRQGRFKYRSIRIPSRHPSHANRSLLQLNRLMPESGKIGVTEMVGGRGGSFGVFAFSPEVFLIKIDATHGDHLQTVRLEFSNGEKGEFGGGGAAQRQDGQHKTSIAFDFADGERVTYIEYYVDPRHSGGYVLGLTLTTNRQGSIIIGNLLGNPHATENFEGHSVALHGVVARSGDVVDAIGFVYSKC